MVYRPIAINVENLRVEIDGKPILEDINLKVYQGEIVAVVGPNGGGKTTFLKTLLGLVKPSRGKVEVFSFPPKEAVRRHLIGYLPQKVNFKRESCLSALDVVLLGLWYKPISEEEKVKLALEVMDKFGVRNLARERFSNLSGGQQQRVNLARTVVGEPKLLLLDEPTTGVDFPGQQTVYELLKKLRDEKDFTIITVTHDVGVVWKYVDRAVCINRKLHYHGEPAAILKPEILKIVYGTEVVLLFHKH
ncbi:MAG TPA: metal ABC transporter ATP-binding protein [Aquificales bacterium]|nr:metal ABC transporter ATP-binding protein [Aquificales bacterium]